VSSSDLVDSLGPGPELVIEGLVRQAAVEDADELIGEFSASDLGRVGPGLWASKWVRAPGEAVRAHIAH
jgi:hypothetical protein